MALMLNPIRAAVKLGQDEAHEANRGQAEAIRRLRRRVVPYGWLEVALISSFGQTPGMALLGLKLIRADGAQVGVTGAFAHVFAPDHLIKALSTPLRDVGPLAEGSALLTLGISNAAAALADPTHRTLWNRLAATRVVRA
jgi:uncharacterized RDD family membrane protein YckC